MWKRLTAAIVAASLSLTLAACDDSPDVDVDDTVGIEETTSTTAAP